MFEFLGVKSDSGKTETMEVIINEVDKWRTVETSVCIQIRNYSPSKAVDGN